MLLKYLSFNLSGKPFQSHLHAACAKQTPLVPLQGGHVRKLWVAKTIVLDPLKQPTNSPEGVGTLQETAVPIRNILLSELKYQFIW